MYNGYYWKDANEAVNIEKIGDDTYVGKVGSVSKSPIGHKLSKEAYDSIFDAQGTLRQMIDKKALHGHFGPCVPDSIYFFKKDLNKIRQYPIFFVFRIDALLFEEEGDTVNISIAFTLDGNKKELARSYLTSTDFVCKIFSRKVTDEIGTLLKPDDFKSEIKAIIGLDLDFDVHY